ncbi:exchange factor for Arf-6-like isoform X2 [Dysidea avara]|uniref:exchange factor for Arf-6-like isoform X2 n=1 Tax=Dysidea avara TaxID=196820 RepID=UPI00332303A2
MSEQPRTVELTRAVEDSGRETFGFSVSGGGVGKLPVVVWEVTPGLPAALSASVNVGDVLLAVNDEQLDNMSQSEVVELITSSPQVSTFVFKSDEVIQAKVKRIKAKQGGGRVKKEQLVEPSVNSGGSSDVVKGSLPTRGLITKGMSTKRSFVQHRSLSTKVQPRHRLSEGEEPLDTSNLLMVPSDGGSPRMTRESLSMSPPSPRQQRLSDIVHCSSQSVDNLPGGSGQWDNSIVSSQSESSMDILSGSCDSLGSATMETNKTCGSPPIVQANLTSLEMGSSNEREEKQLGCSHDLTIASSTETTQCSLENIVEEPHPQQLATEQPNSSAEQSHPLIAEEPPPTEPHPSDGLLKTSSLQSNASAQSIGDVILPTSTIPNKAYPEVKHMTSVEIRQSKYGPHRYSNSDEPSDTGSHGGNTGFHNNDTGSHSSDIGSHDDNTGSQNNDVGSRGDDTTNRDDSNGSRGTGSHGDDSNLRNVRARIASLRGATSETDFGLRVRRTLSGRPLRTLDSREEAVILARKLYMLDGYKRSEVASHLSAKSPFSQNVAEEYLKFFEFENVGLDPALRQFVCSFTLSGETYEQERIMQYFSCRFHQCNPTLFANSDSCHSLICALLLLNTDLHAEHTGSRMTQTQFITNLQGTGESYPKEMLKGLYDSIKKNALPLAIDDVKDSSSQPLSQNGTGNHEPPTGVPVYHVTFPGTFIEVDLAGDAPVFKEGEIYRKNVMEAPHKKVQSGKRKWKPYYAYLKGFLLYFIEPHEELYLDKTTNALPITHCIAQRAFDYHKRSSVLRITTSDWKVFLLQAPSVTEMQQWMSAINKAAGTYSSIPLAAPIGSSSHFQRPMLPLAPTKLTHEQQLESHNNRVKSLEKDLEEHRAYHSGNVSHKGKSNQAWREKLDYFEFEITRYRIYIACMTSTSIEDLQTPIPSFLVPSPSISTLATVNVDDCTFEPPSPTLSTHSHSAFKHDKKHKRKHH